MDEIEFRISSAVVGPAAQVVALGGEIDVSSAPRLHDALDDAIESGARHVVVDLAGASFVDSTVTGVLLSAHERLQRLAGRLVVVSDDPRILRTFQLTGLDRVLSVERSLTETVARLGRVGAPA